MESSPQDEDYFVKLELLKDIRQKTVQAEKMKLNIKDILEDLNNEEKSLNDYQSEVDLLVQEKMAHVEELRLIHTDINTMENLIKQGRSARQKLVDEVRRNYDEFLPLKNELNELREQIGIDPLQDLDALTTIPHLQDSNVSDTKILPATETPDRPTPVHLGLPPDSLQSGKLNIGKASVRHQQPPPMKSCQSCHQLIHRNAPICPLCKAKSRSRNPKKTKRKHDF